jgi:hypothetical protein
VAGLSSSGPTIVSCRDEDVGQVLPLAVAQVDAIERRSALGSSPTASRMPWYAAIALLVVLDLVLVELTDLGLDRRSARRRRDVRSSFLA